MQKLVSTRRENGFIGSKFKVDYEKSCCQAQVKVEQARNSIFFGGGISKIAQSPRDCLCALVEDTIFKNCIL